MPTQCRFCDVGAVTSRFERSVRHCCDRLSSRRRWGRRRGVSEAYRAAIGREEDRLAIHADVGRFGTDDPATWSIGDQLTFLELKLIDMLGRSSPKRPSVYWKLTLLEGTVHGVCPGGPLNLQGLTLNGSCGFCPLKSGTERHQSPDAGEAQAGRAKGGEPGGWPRLARPPGVSRLSVRGRDVEVKSVIINKEKGVIATIVLDCKDRRLSLAS
ncbi:hypothetical protein THAOC_21040 [Thalassiosira oceanica]|uniref:Uncharacterized protein n=1 Tax=Thalassiosira oceanica TaxID=159749 RepID=K0S1Y7_THAOC|nr:hypothetical protein THAOC_21040 [Thalassiosira oceanica]|eukprot:EJK58804.1 hypothetical protein THAOC_21040 [Thalassiosira oceanica]